MRPNETQKLPLGWVVASLGEVLPLSYGKGLTEKQRETTGSVPVYGSSGIVGKHSEALTSGRTLIVGRKGSVGEVHYSHTPCWPIDTTYFVEATESTNLRFFGYLLQAVGLGRLDKSTTIPGLSRDDYNVTRVTLPPLPEQHRIVAEIEKQFTRLDAGVAALERARANLKHYRASVLKAACEGRLVPTEVELARTEGRKYEPAEQLLARILKERRAKWEADQLAKMQAQGKVPKDDTWKEKYQEPTGPDTTDLPKLPEGWVIASMDQLTAHITSGSRDWSKYYGRGQGVFLMAQNVRSGRLDLTYRQLVDPPKDDRDRVRSQVQEDDLLVTIVGANTGDVCRVPKELDEHFICQSVALMRPVDSRISCFLEIYMTSEENGQRQYRRYIYGAGRPHLSFDQLKMTLILFPPLAEQHCIVTEVERRLSILDELKATVDANLKRAERLRQSILKRAFEGKLVPQDLNDEPASVLLERIRAERQTPPQAIVKAASRLSRNGKRPQVTETQTELFR